MSYLAVGLVASDIPQVGGGGGTVVNFTGGTTKGGTMTPSGIKDTGPGFWASLAKGLNAASPLFSSSSGGTSPSYAPAPAPTGMSSTTKTLLLVGGATAAALILVLALK